MLGEETKPLAAKKILVVDDDPFIRQLLIDTLSGPGFKVVTAENGPEAVVGFREQRPDLILLDVNLPGLNGFMVCEQIRRQPGGDQTAIIMVTGLDDYESITHAFEAGATDFVIKPFNPLLLQHRIRYILRANRAFDELLLTEAKLAKALEIADFCNWEWELSSNELHWSVEMERLFGLEPGGFNGRYNSFLLFVHDDDRSRVRKIIDTAIAENKPFSVEHRILLPDGKERIIYQEGKMIVGRQAQAERVLVIAHDVTQKRNSEKEIKFLAYYDRLTELPNRFLFTELLEKSIASAGRHNRMLGVLFLDLDNFRSINDSFGRELGDQLLKIVAARLADCLRANDTAASMATSNNVAARFGADEFGVVLEDLTESANVALVARRIIEKIGQVIVLEEREFFLNSRIGVSIYPSDGESGEELMRHADAALSRAKKLEKNTYQFYTADLNAKAFARFALETSLRKAVDRQEFVLFYQPQVELHSGKVVAVEALVRWQHPDMGLVPPMDFIPLAEETGLIIPLGNWVLQAACRQCRAWQEAGLVPVKVAVNLSVGQFKDRGLVGVVRRVLQAVGADSRLLEFEITESMLMDHVKDGIATLDQLSGLGSSLSIDDFGTGYSSLSYLKRFPVYALKIDRSFVHDINQSSDDAAIVKAIITMAHSLNLKVIAEGVETKEQLAFLRELGCDYVQGFLISRPVPAAEVVNFFGDWRITDL